MLSPSLKQLLLFSSLSTLLTPTLAQTWTDCNPMEKTCPDDIALGIKNYTTDFTKSLSTKIWNHTNGVTTASSEGTTFQIAKRLQSPTIQSVFNIFFGSVEVVMKSAAGQGIISSIVIQSDNLDEIDWEWIGSNNTIAQSNYFGKGNQTSFDRAVYHTVKTPNDIYHNYTINWTPQSIQWIIDSTIVRTLPYASANGGQNYPQTPSTVRIGIWAGGDSSMPAGTVEWAQGSTDYSLAPFNMIVKSAVISDYSTGSAYHWSDKTGSFNSIKPVTGTSSVAKAIQNPTSSADLSDGTNTTSSTTNTSTNSNTVGSGLFTTSNTLTSAISSYKSLSTPSKIGIAVGTVAFLALLFGSLAFLCVRQRRKGAVARAAEAERLAKEAEVNEMRWGHLGVKEQDALPMGSMTPARYEQVTHGNGVRGGETAYYGVHEIEGVEGYEGRSGGWRGEIPPAYSGNGSGGGSYEQRRNENGNRGNGRLGY